MPADRCSERCTILSGDVTVPVDQPHLHAVYLWAMLFLVQASVTALIIRQTDYATAYNYDQLLPFVATALGIVGSIAIGRSFTKKGTARDVVADAADTDCA